MRVIRWGREGINPFDKLAVQIGLSIHGKIWEDLCDRQLIEERKEEPDAPWGEVKKDWQNKEDCNMAVYRVVYSLDTRLHTVRIIAIQHRREFYNALH